MLLVTVIAACNTSYGSNAYADLLACSGNAATSCFNESSSNSVCGGCVDWQDEGITVPTNPLIVPQCQYPNPYWVGSTKFNAPGVLFSVLPYKTRLYKLLCLPVR